MTCDEEDGRDEIVTSLVNTEILSEAKDTCLGSAPANM
jgi:hypothetical protein